MEIAIDENVKGKLLELAEQAGMTPDDVEKLFAVIITELEDQGEDPEEIPEIAVEQLSARLKKRITKKGKTKPATGFTIMRHKAINRSNKHIRIAKAYLEQHGMEKSVEDGYYDEEGNILYVDDKYKSGHIVPEEDWEANGLGMFQYEDKIKFTQIKFKGDAATKPIETFREATYDIYPVEVNEGNVFKFTCFSLPEEYEAGYIDLTSVLPDIKEHIGDRFVKSLVELPKYYKERVEENKFQNEWGIIKANISSIKPASKKGWTPVIVDDMSLLMNDSEDEQNSYAVLFPPEMNIDLTANASRVYFIGDLSKNDKGEIAMFATGYWVKGIYRSNKSKAEEVPDTQDAWG
jgi:hypothetical protein